MRGFLVNPLVDHIWSHVRGQGSRIGLRQGVVMRGNGRGLLKDLSETGDSFSIAKRKYNLLLGRNSEDALSFDEFCNFYGSDLDSQKRQCAYCGLREDQAARLREKGFIYSKLPNRGYTMETDRKNPSGPYTLDNIVLCCYWCNNAKTDEFTSEEFKKIGAVLELIWKERLRKGNLC